MIRSRRYGLAAAALALVVVLAGCGNSGGAPQTVRIGVDLELTGPGSPTALVIRQALQLRVDQVNSAGLLGYRRLELLVRDNRGDSAVAASNVQSLAADPTVVAVVMGTCELCVQAAVPTIASQRVPVVALGSASDLVEPIDERRYVFKLGPDASDVAALLVRELGRMGADTVGLIATDRPYGVEGRAELSAAADRSGLDLVAGPAIGDDGQGVEVSVGAVLAGNDPDAVVLWASGPATAAAAVRLRAQGYTGPLLLAPSAADQIFITSSAREALSGARMVFTEALVIDGLIASSPAKAARQSWLRDYTAQEGTYHAQASFAADAVQVIVEAINRYGTTDRDQVRTALENTQIDGFTGPIRFRLETHSGLSPQALVMLVVQGDRWRLAAG